MTTDSPTIAVGADLDGVFAGYGDHFLRRYALDPAQNRHYFFTDSYGPTITPLLETFHDDPCTWVSMPSLPGAREAYERICAATEQPLILVSFFPERMQLLRLWWLAEHLGAKGTFGLCRAPARESKLEIAQALGLTHFIEDHLETAKLLHDHGIQSFMVCKPDGTPYTYDTGQYPEVPRIPLLGYAALIEDAARSVAHAG